MLLTCSSLALGAQVHKGALPQQIRGRQLRSPSLTREVGLDAESCQVGEKPLEVEGRQQRARILGRLLQSVKG